MKLIPDKRNTLLLLIAVNTVLFLLLAVLHFYWSTGGRLWYDAVLPTNSSGTNRLNPSPAAGLTVAFGLLFFAFLTIGNAGLFDRYVKRKYFRLGILIITLLFLLRAIGDFKFVGFFKTIRGTRFGINDTLLFSPLCTFLALSSLTIFALSRNKR